MYSIVPGSPHFVPEVKMVSSRVVKINGLLDQSEAKHLSVELENSFSRYLAIAVI